MRTATTIRMLALLLLLLPALLAPPARADEAESESSAAAEAFREGFWQETGSGALDKALELYGKALAAEGSAAVKARALYRTAVVLQRMGRTTEAVKALERLSNEFPDQPAVLADAKERLEEWSAVDLRTSFEEWYARYQFTPEFQAKILDLVRTLGTGEEAGASSELLTIGAPALPALRMYAESANPDLREKVVKLLIRLGEVPSARALLETADWSGRPDGWAALLATPAPMREKRRAELSGEGPRVVAVRAALGGREGILGALEREDPAEYSDDLVQVLLPDGSPHDPATVERLEAAMLRPDAPVSVAAAIFQAMERDRVAVGRVVSWLPRVSRDLQHVMLWHLASATNRDADAFRKLVAFLAEHPSPRGALAAVRMAEAAPEGADLSAAVQAVVASRVTHWSAESPAEKVASGPRGYDVLHGVALSAEDEAAALPAWSVWQQHAKTPQHFEKVLELAKSARTASVRVGAASSLGASVREGPSLDAAFDFLAGDAGDREAAIQFGRGLVNVLNQRSLPLRAKHLRALRALPVDPYYSLVAKVLDRPGGRELIVDALLEDPTAVPPGFIATRARLGDPDRERAFARAVAAWPSWSPEQRLAALTGLLSYLGADERPELVAFLRNQLGVGEEVPQVKRAILEFIAPAGPITLEDLRAVYGIADPASSEDVARWLPTMSLDAEAYRALRPLVQRHPMLLRHFLDAGLLDVVADDALASPEVAVRIQVLNVLANARDPKHLPLVRKLLEDSSPQVRAQAAGEAGFVYDKETILALTRLLDDPAPSVREKALVSLEKIQKFEEQKTYWREFAEKLK